jgi:hypothetical protein
MVVVFGKTIDEIEDAIDLSLVWTFRVERDRINFLKDNDTWVKPNLEGIGTPQEVMKYITYAIANEAKVCFITADVIKAVREEFNGEDKYKKQRRLREALAALNKED